MARHSRSPPPRRRYDDDPRERKNDERYKRDERRHSDYDRRSRRDEDSRYGRGRYKDMEGRDKHDYGRSNRRRDGSEEREKERERERERERDRDRAGPSRRRSASPRRSRPRSASKSPSPPSVDKAKPNFAPSGLLAAATNTVKAADGTSTVLKYNEPPEARKPVLGWRLYVFKGSEQVELLHIQRQSAYLIGRDRMVADIALEHPSCSKQHAVIQYRLIHEKNEFGESKGVVKPFIIDLESTNGTHVNDGAIPTSRFYELKPSDVIKFGLSTREYVLLHDESL